MEKILKLYKYVDGINDTPFPNNEQQAILYDFTYDAKRMGNNIPTISGTIMHSLCLDELWGNELVYVVYKGEKYFVKQKPTSSYSNEDTRYKHEISFISERNILNEVYFYDVVDSSVSYDKYVSNSSNVVFYGDINELAQRLREALKYAKIDYDVVVDANVTSETKLVTFSDMFIIDVLNEAYSIYKVPHYFDGKAIHFGYTNNNIDTILKYGIDNALLSIRKNYSNKRIINRATGIGSADNIPYYYPNFDAKGVTNILYNGVDNQSAIVSNKAKYRKVKLGDVFTYASANSYTLEYIDKSKYSVTKEPTLLSEPYETTKKYELILDFPFNVDIHREMVMYIGYSKDHLTRAYTRLYRNSELWDKFTTLGTFYYDRLIEGEYNISITLAFEFKETDEKQTITNEDIPDIVDALELSIHTDISGYHNWKLNSSPLDVQIEDYGIQLNVTPKNGDKITFEQVSYIPPQPNLMPSIYRENGGLERFYNALNNTYINPETNEYYLFENPYQEGKQKEEIVSFDYIKPSIVGITNAQGQRIDMFVEFAYDTNDNDEFDENGNYLHPYFFAKLRKFDGDYGFNLFDHAIEENEMKIAMTSGSCGACEFIIGVSEKTQENTVQVDSNGNLLRDSNGNVLFGSPQAQQNDTINNEVWIALKKDIETFGVIMPNATNNYKPSANDTFVILHIDLPDEYILAAENRLKEEIIKHIYTNNTAKFNLSIMFSRIYLADNPTIANSINENARIKVAYNEFVYTLYVSSYSYRMRSDEPLPEIEVELSEELEIRKAPLQKITSTSQQIAQSVEQVNNKVTTTDRVVSSTQSQTQANVQNIEERIANIERILRNSQGNTDNLQDYYDRITKVITEIEKFWKYNEENNALITEYNVVSQGTMSFGGIDDGESGEGGGTGITSLYDIPEIAVSVATLADGQSLVYDATLDKWVNRLVQGGSGVDMDYVWAALAGATDEKINVSHIPDLSDVYLPTSNLLTEMLKVDGSGSGLDADLLDGLDEISFVRNGQGINLEEKYLRHIGYGYEAAGWFANAGPAMAFGASNGYTMLMQQQANAYTLYVSYKTPDGTIRDWKTIAFTDSDITGSAGSAKVLNNYYTSRPTSADIDIFGDGGVRHILASSSMTNNKPASDGSILTFEWDSKDGYSKQLFIGDRNGISNANRRLQWRSQNAGTWSDWKTVAFTDSTIANADKLGGYSSSLYMKGDNVLYDPATLFSDNRTIGIYRYNYLPSDAPSEATAYGNLMVIRSGGRDTLSQIYFNHNNYKIFVRSGSTATTSPIYFADRDWKQLAFTDSDITGNADSATKLQTVRKIWGRTFDGTGNITSHLELGNSIAIKVTDTKTNTLRNALVMDSSNSLLIGSGNVASDAGYMTHIYGKPIRFSISSDNHPVTITSNANVLIGTTTENIAYKLNVVGAARISDTLNLGAGVQIGNNALVSFLSKVTETETTAKYYNGLYLSPANNFQIGYGTAISGGFKTNLHGKGIELRSRGNDVATMSLTTDGNVGIGTTTPAYKLEVNGTTHLNGKVTLTKDVVLNNYTAIKFKDSNGAELNTIMVGTDNALTIGADHAANNYETRIKGSGVTLFYGGTQVLSLTSGSNISAKNILPFEGNIYDLGSSNNRWNTIYSASLNLSGNISSGNILPLANNTYNLGTSDTRWGVLYAYYGSFTNGVNSRYYYTLDGTIKAFDANNTYLAIGDGYIANELPIYINGKPIQFRASSTPDLTIDANGNAIFYKYLSSSSDGTHLLNWYGEGRFWNLMPQTTELYNLGSGDKRWASAHIKDVVAYNSVKIGDATLTWDVVNQCLVVDKNFAADGSISFGGLEPPTEDDYLATNGGTILGNLGIGNASNTGKNLNMYGSMYFYLNSNPTAYKMQLWMDGNSRLALRNPTDHAATKFYVYGDIIYNGTCGKPSDMRLKHIIEDMCLSSETIANAPLFRYKRKGSEDDRVYIGSSAQYWQKVAPELTPLVDDYLTLDYTTLGVMMGKSNATEIELLKERMKILEAKVENYERILGII